MGGRGGLNFYAGEWDGRPETRAGGGNTMSNQEDANKHEFEKYPYGSFKRLFAAFEELTGVDILKMEAKKDD